MKNNHENKIEVVDRVVDEETIETKRSTFGEITGGGESMNDIEYVAIAALTPHPKNDSLYGEVDDVTDLVTSIEENGFDETEPIETVDEADYGWPANRIVSGHRRFAAARQADLAEVPARVVEFESEDAELDYLVRKNKYRQKTDAMLIREGYDFETRHGEDIEGRTRDAVAERIGKSGPWYRMGKRVMLAAENGVLGDEPLDDGPREVARSEWERLQNGNSSVSGAHREIERTCSETEVEDTTETPDGERVNDYTGAPKDGEEYVYPVNLGWVGQLEGELAAKAREIGEDELREQVIEVVRR
jgi:hypothetical protein